MLIVMCGLPGSGKSTLSRALAQRLGVLRWDKDELRHLLFPPEIVVHERALNDFCMELLYSAARQVFAGGTSRAPVVIIDGRTFVEARQRLRAREIATETDATIVFVRCHAPMEILRQRIADAVHPAPDRTPALLERLADRLDTFEVDEIVVDTAALTPPQAVLLCVEQLTARGLISA